MDKLFGNLNLVLGLGFALAGLRIGGVTILDPACTGKTYPDYWDMLAGLGVDLTPAAPPGRCSADKVFTTGTGASGEMRPVSPNQYSSSIASPIATTREARADSSRLCRRPRLIDSGMAGKIDRTRAIRDAGNGRAIPAAA